MTSLPTSNPKSPSNVREQQKQETQQKDNEKKGDLTHSRTLTTGATTKIADRQDNRRESLTSSSTNTNLSLPSTSSPREFPQPSALKKKLTPPIEPSNQQPQPIKRHASSSGFQVPQPPSPTVVRPPNRPSNRPSVAAGAVPLNPSPRSPHFQLAKTPSEKALSLPPSEHFKMCLYKMETDDYNGAYLDITQCTALLANRHTKTGGDVDPRRIRLCVAYKLALNILIDVKKRQNGDQSGPLGHRHLIQYLQENNRISPVSGANVESTKHSSSTATISSNDNKNSPTSTSSSSSSSSSVTSTSSPVPLTPQIIAHIAMLTKFLADLPLLPRHRLICYRMAIKWNMEAKNYGIAASLIRTLLKKKILDKPELEKKLRVCEERHFKDENPIPSNAKLCYKSLKQVLMGAYTQCKFCEAVYADDIQPPSVCTYCMVGKLYKPLLPLLSKKQ